ncbi:MAG: TolC family protein [Candidatus Poribacteria bacterium]|nr:TolC family protein [Candidatus Poribacteria bacterium]
MKTKKRENGKTRKACPRLIGWESEEVGKGGPARLPIVMLCVSRFIWFSLLPMLLVACASGRQETYQDLLTQFEEAPTPEYYRVELAKEVRKPETDEPAETDAFLSEVEAKVLKFQKEWEAQLESENPIPEAFYDFGTPQRKAYRQLATKAEEAKTRLAEAVDLDLLLALGYEWNPKLKAARLKLRATLEQYPQAVYLDNVLRQYNAFTKQLDTKIGKPRHKEMMAMKFPFPDMLSLKGQVVTEDAQIAQREIEIVLRDLVTNIRLAYYDYLFINEAIGINGENQELLRQMIQIAQAKYRAGIGKYHSVIMAQVELSKLSDSIITLEEQRETIIARINTLLNRPADAPLGMPQPLDPEEVALPLADLYTLALKRRQEIQKQKLTISKMNLMVQLATRMAYPDATLGASYFEDRMKLSTGTAKMPPTFFTQRTLNPANSAWFGRRNAYIREVEIKVDAMEQMLKGIEDMTRFAVKKHHFGLETAKRSIALYRYTLLPQAQQAIDAANIAYQAAQVDFLSFLDAQRTLLKFRLEEQRALRDHRHHLAQLEQAVGQVLPKQPMKLTNEEE